MHRPIAATGLLEPIPRSPIHPKAAARFPAAFRALFRFPTRTVRKPQEVVILVTIMACLMVETDDRQWARHIRKMPLYWLCYRHNNQVSVVIEPASSLIHARLRASLDGLDQNEFTEGHELDRKWRVPKEMIGRRLSQQERKR